jgi:transcriptional regulator with XRE-family HTH domain
MERQSNEPIFFPHLGQYLAIARRQRNWTQERLAVNCNLNKSDIVKIETGRRLPTLKQLAKLANVLGLPLQWFINGTPFPDDKGDLTLELHRLGVVDLVTASDRILGAFRPPEEVVTLVLSGDLPNPRIVEAIPAVLAWNAWNTRLLEAYALSSDPRASHRLAWLADVALSIHRMHGFPGGFIAPFPLEEYVRHITPPQTPDDLGRPDLHETLPPVSKRWNIRYAANLETFYRRALHLFELRSTEQSLGTRRKKKE